MISEWAESLISRTSKIRINSSRFTSVKVSYKRSSRRGMSLLNARSIEKCWERK